MAIPIGIPTNRDWFYTGTRYLGKARKDYGWAYPNWGDNTSLDTYNTDMIIMRTNCIWKTYGIKHQKSICKQKPLKTLDD